MWSLRPCPWRRTRGGRISNPAHCFCRVQPGRLGRTTRCDSVSSAVPVIESARVLSPEECAREIERAGRQGFVEQAFRGEERPEVRNRATIDDPDAAAWLWTRVSSALPPLVQLY